ncbi:MAG: hypothetical protein Q4D50_08215 [Eubacteriales bacterium]|nr:hypothetical protein [Eubacteriales bacterium]
MMILYQRVCGFRGLAQGFPKALINDQTITPSFDYFHGLASIRKRKQTLDEVKNHAGLKALSPLHWYRKANSCSAGLERYYFL